MRIRGVGAGTLIKVLTFVLISAIFTVVLGLRISNYDPFRRDYTLQAEFTDATGVFKGDAVKLAGVDVGRVQGTEIEAGKAVVTFTVERSVVLPPDTRVGIRWRNVLGLRFLYLFPGLGDGPPLEDGDRIPVDRTDTSGDIGEFLNRLGPILQAIDPDKANAFLESMNTALVGNEAVVRTLLTQGAVVAEDLGDMDREIRSLISSSDTILAAYASQDQALDAILEDLDVVSGELAGATPELNSLITNLAVVQEHMERLLRNNRGTIDASLRDLRTVASTLAERRRALSRLMCSLPSGVAPYFETTSWGEWFNVRIAKIVVKDPEGNEIASAQEDEGTRPPQAPPVQICPDGTPTRGRGLVNPSSGEPPRGAPVRREGLGGWLDDVVDVTAGG